jgi:hypothetical protein
MNEEAAKILGHSEFFINLEELAVRLTNAEDEQGRKMMISPEEVIPLVPEIAKLVSERRAEGK